jgi:hypothetical protein
MCLLGFFICDEGKTNIYVQSYDGIGDIVLGITHETMHVRTHAVCTCLSVCIHICHKLECMLTSIHHPQKTRLSSVDAILNVN